MTTDKGIFTADGAVVTLPLGVLKASSVEFSPPLPERKQAAIRRLGMGVLNKVVLRFPKMFWAREPHFLGYFSDTKGEYPVFLNVARYADAPLLVAFTGGNFARSLEKLTDKEVAGRVTDVIRKIGGSPVPDLVGVKVTRWAADGFAGGAYSHIPVGASSKDYEILAEPVGERLFFAGEATNRQYPGTVHGAFLSGVRVADRIAKR